MPVVTPTRESVSAYVAVGANLGDALAAVTQAIKDLHLLPLTECVASSALYQSAPYQAVGPAFINAVVSIRTRLTAFELLNELQSMEEKAWRIRSYLNAPRQMDLDILFYGDAKVFSQRLMIPHPRWMERAFVLWPLQELAPYKVIPVMLHAVADQVIHKLP